MSGWAGHEKHFTTSEPGPEVIKHFSCSAQLRLKFFLLINVKNCQHFNIYEQDKLQDMVI